MIIPTHILRDTEEDVLCESLLSLQGSISDIPESRKAIYMAFLLIRVFTLAVPYQTVHVALGSYSHKLFRVSGHTVNPRFTRQ